MVSLRTFTKHINQFFTISEPGTLIIQVGYKKKVFVVTIEPTANTYKPLYRKRKIRQKRGPVPIETSKCEVCGHIVVANVCINKKCETNTVSH